MTHQSEQQKSTHLIFDGEKIVVSPDISPVMIFLMEIEKEINSFMGFHGKLEKIKTQHLETLKLVEFLVKKLKNAKIDFEYNMKEIPASIAEKFHFDSPIRSQMIVLFASLEVLYFLHIAYEKEIDDENQMREVATKDKEFLKKFINSFLLNEENIFYKDNKKRFLKIDSRKIRDLRNSLTHFFSLSASGLAIAPKFLDEKSRKLENIFKKNKNGHIVFISPEDLQELIKSAHILRIIKWNNNFYNDRSEFKRRFQFVIGLVEKYGAIYIYDKQLNI